MDSKVMEMSIERIVLMRPRGGRKALSLGGKRPYQPLIPVWRIYSS